MGDASAASAPESKKLCDSVLAGSLALGAAGSAELHAEEVGMVDCRAAAAPVYAAPDTGRDLEEEEEGSEEEGTSPPRRAPSPSSDERPDEEGQGTSQEHMKS